MLFSSNSFSLFFHFFFSCSSCSTAPPSDLTSSHIICPITACPASTHSSPKHRRSPTDSNCTAPPAHTTPTSTPGPSSNISPAPTTRPCPLPTNNTGDSHRTPTTDHCPSRHPDHHYQSPAPDPAPPAAPQRPRAPAAGHLPHPESGSGPDSSSGPAGRDCGRDAPADQTATAHSDPAAGRRARPSAPDPESGDHPDGQRTGAAPADPAALRTAAAAEEETAGG